MQGARYTTTVVDENYSPETSNLLREPLLARALNEKIGSLPADLQSSPLVAKLRDVLPQIEKILNVPRDGAISKGRRGAVKQAGDRGGKGRDGRDILINKVQSQHL